jgi:hypothetical protein
MISANKYGNGNRRLQNRQKSKVEPEKKKDDEEYNESESA